MKKFTAYHLNLEDVRNILGGMGYKLKGLDCDKGTIGINVEVPDGKNEDDFREQMYNDFEEYLQKFLGVENPVYFCSDGDQPDFELLVVPSNGNYSVI